MRIAGAADETWVSIDLSRIAEAVAALRAARSPRPAQAAVADPPARGAGGAQAPAAHHPS